VAKDKVKKGASKEEDTLKDSGLAKKLDDSSMLDDEEDDSITHVHGVEHSDEIKNYASSI